MNIEQKIIGSGIGFLLTVIAGIWLSHSGRPYNKLIFNVHKLIALFLVIITGILIINLLKGITIEIVLIVLLIIAIVSVLELFVSGAFLSVGNISFSIAKKIHLIASLTSITSIALVIYLTLTII